MQPSWYFGLLKTLQRWWDDPSFEDLRRQGLAERRGGYMDAEEFTRLK